MDLKNQTPFVQEIYKNHYDLWKVETFAIAFREPKEKIYGADRVPDAKKCLDTFIRNIVEKTGYDYNEVKEALRIITELDMKEMAEFYAENPVTGC